MNQITSPSECPQIKDEDIKIASGTLVKDTYWKKYVYIISENPEQMKQQILDARELKREIDDIKANMKTSEYLYSGEFSKIVMDRITKIFGDKMIQ